MSNYATLIVFVLCLIAILKSVLLCGIRILNRTLTWDVLINIVVVMFVCRIGILD